MDEKLKRTICGSLISIFLISSTPICNRCLLHMKENPHTVEVDCSINPTTRIDIVGITSTATTVAHSTFDKM